MSLGGKFIWLAAIAAAFGYWAGVRTGNHYPAAIAQVAQPLGEKGEGGRKLLYYRNPMGLPDTSPTPKKDPMGMDYTPVYADNEVDNLAAVGQISISTEKVQKLGVRTEKASFRPIDKMIRASGRIEPDERRVYVIAPRFDGYIDKLYVNITGQPVGKGQPLFEVYSPELVSAQREYAIAVQGIASLNNAGGEAQASMRRLAESSLARLKNWDISEEQVKTLARLGKSRHTLSFLSPVSGIVTEKKAVQGMRFMQGEALYRVADLSTIWVIADIFEKDIGVVKVGTTATLTINAYPDKRFSGVITYVYSTLQTETRTIPVRIELTNPDGLLKPGMFAKVEIPSDGNGSVIAVPVSAVIDSGTRQIILVQAKAGRYEPREVTLGARSDHYVAVLSGIQDGEDVVVYSNFLIDAESNLQAAIGGFSNAGVKALSRKSEMASVGYQAKGTVDEVDAKTATLTIRHGPIEKLHWPAMSMEFNVANDSLLQGITAGAVVSFEFVERGPGEWVITKMQSGTKAADDLKPIPAHAQH